MGLELKETGFSAVKEHPRKGRVGMQAYDSRHYGSILKELTTV